MKGRPFTKEEADWVLAPLKRTQQDRDNDARFLDLMTELKVMQGMTRHDAMFATLGEMRARQNSFGEAFIQGIKEARGIG